MCRPRRRPLHTLSALSCRVVRVGADVTASLCVSIGWLAVTALPVTRLFARRATLRRSVRLLSDFRFEQTDPDRFYGALATDCLELIGRYGPMSPSAVARRAGLHPATLTGVLDRLQRGGWIVRERDPEGADRRAVTVRALRDRNAEVYQLYSGMNGTLDGILTDYSVAELEILVDFLQRTTTAGNSATAALAEA